MPDHQAMWHMRPTNISPNPKHFSSLQTFPWIVPLNVPPPKKNTGTFLANSPRKIVYRGQSSPLPTSQF